MTRRQQAQKPAEAHPHKIASVDTTTAETGGPSSRHQRPNHGLKLVLG